MTLARLVEDAYARAKGSGRLDQGDLLRRCLDAFAEHPELSARYRERFRVIMVDEFQDTDKLQVAVIGALAQPGFANVCTVGDAQQSIYRFRGADVNVFFEYRDRLRTSLPTRSFPRYPTTSAVTATSWRSWMPFSANPRCSVMSSCIWRRPAR